MKRIKSWFKKEDGVALVLTALCLTAIVSMMALVIDLGIAAYRRAEIQGICDVTALASARYLNRDHNPGIDVLKTYGQECFKLNVNAKYPSNIKSVKWENTDADYNFKFNPETGRYDRVTVTAKLTVQTNFARVMGINEMEIHVLSTAYSDFALDPSSMWLKSLVSNEPISFKGKDAQFASVHANLGIDFGNNTNFIVETVASTSNGKIEGTESNPPLNLTGDETKYESGIVANIEAEGAKMKNYLDKLSASSLGSYGHVWEDSLNGKAGLNFYNSADAAAAAEIFELESGFKISTKRKFAYYADAGSEAKIDAEYITIKHDIYVVGDINFYGNKHTYIEPGVTVYVTGNATFGNNLTCNGNLVVLGDLKISGGVFDSPSEKTEYAMIYIGGKSADFGTAGSLCKNISICAPKCDFFQISGGNTTFMGTIMGNNLSDIGSGTLKVINPTMENPLIDKINMLCLVE